MICNKSEKKLYKQAVSLAEIIIAMMLFACLAMLFMNICMKAIEKNMKPTAEQQAKLGGDAYNYSQRVKGIVYRLPIELPTRDASNNPINYTTAGVTVRITRTGPNGVCAPPPAGTNNITMVCAVSGSLITTCDITIKHSGKSDATFQSAGGKSNAISLLDSIITTYPNALVFKNYLENNNTTPSPATVNIGLVCAADDTYLPDVTNLPDVVIPFGPAGAPTVPYNMTTKPIRLQISVYDKALDKQTMEKE